MFSLMGNCISCIKRQKQPTRPVTLAILGLDSAGKTTTTKALLGDDLETAPTIGFNKEDVDFLNYNITLYDLGGGSRIRAIWKDYLAEIYGVIYVVDSAAPERFEEVKDVLKDLLENDRVKGKPLLILANKEDIPDHCEEVEIMDRLSIEDLVNVNKCYCKMEMCSAIKGSGRKMDSKIRDGMTWMCGMLDKLYDKMKERVDADMEVVEQIRQKEKEERKERVRKQREERERKAEEERKKLGEDKVEDEDDDDGDFVDGDPFRRLDAEEVKRKEEKWQQTKAKEKERQRKLKELEEHSNKGNTSDRITNSTNSNATSGKHFDDDDDDDGLRVPRSSRSLFGPGWMNETSNGHTRQLLPPLESQSARGTGISPRSDKKRNKKMKNKVESRDIGNEFGGSVVHGTSSMSRIQVEPINGHDDDDDENDSVIQSSGRRPFRKSRGLYVDDSGHDDSPPSERKKKTKKKQQVVTSEDEDGFDTLRLSQHVDENDLNRYSKLTDRTNNSNKYPVNSHILTNGNDDEDRPSTPVRKLKKKKKHLRKHRLGPSDDEFELSDVQTTPKKQSWRNTPSPRKMLDDDDSRINWGLADDLPSGDEVQQFRRSRPNFDADDNLQL